MLSMNQYYRAVVKKVKAKGESKEKHHLENMNSVLLLQ